MKTKSILTFIKRDEVKQQPLPKSMRIFPRNYYQTLGKIRESITLIHTQINKNIDESNKSVTILIPTNGENYYKQAQVNNFEELSQAVSDHYGYHTRILFELYGERIIIGSEQDL